LVLFKRRIVLLPDPGACSSPSSVRQVAPVGESTRLERATWPFLQVYAFAVLPIPTCPSWPAADPMLPPILSARVCLATACSDLVLTTQRCVTRNISGYHLTPAHNAPERAGAAVLEFRQPIFPSARSGRRSCALLAQSHAPCEQFLLNIS
jgi:hypothetical protein